MAACWHTAAPTPVVRGYGPAVHDPRPEVEIELLELSSRHADHDDGDRLSVAGLSVRYGNRVVVRDVTLRVGPGEVVVLLGHNGCGKSSTLRAIVGLASRQGGDVVVEGRDLTEVPSANRAAGVGFVPATGEVFADLSVRENLVLAAGRPKDRSMVDERFDAALAQFDGLRRLLPRQAGALSGGERRLVGIAMGLMADPHLLLLDEPTKHLAPATAAGILATVAAVARRLRLGVLVAEVNVAAALQVADRVYVMRSGEVIAEHTGTELLAAGPRTWWSLF